MADLKLILCKGYLYSGGTQIQPATLPIYISDDIFNAYKQYENEYTIIPETSIGADDNFWASVNKAVGASIVNKNFPVYYNATPSYPWTQTEKNQTVVTGFYYEPVTNPADDYLTFKTLDGVACDRGIVNSIASTYYPSACFVNSTFSKTYHEATIRVLVFPSTVFGEDGKVANREGIEIKIYIKYTNQDVLDTYRLTVVYAPYAFGSVSAWLNGFNLNTTQPTEIDPENPYDDDGDPGGDGPNLDPQQDPTDFPDLPDTSLGMVTLFRPTQTVLNNLGSFLWSGPFDPDTFKKLFTNPMDCIIGLSIVPASPSIHSNKNIFFGNVDSGVLCDYVSTQYCKVNCGSVKIDKKVGDFLDYEATKVSIFLPFIGFRELSTVDVMGQTITVEYNVDVLSGACAAFIKVGSRGVMYSYNGSCISNVPLTATNFSGAIQNAVSAVSSGAGIIAGAMTGAAPLTAMSAVSLATTAANTLLNSKPSIQRSGNLGGSAGIMSGKKPFVIIERPNYSVPDFYQNYVGRVSNKTASLGSLSGFTMVDSIHLENVPATAAEITEIETLLKQGVIL